MKTKCILGRRFGLLTVIRQVSLTPKYLHECACKCGGVVEVSRDKLISGHTKSCGCLKHKVRFDLAGKTFGRLKVISLSGRNRHGRSLWKCVCECGGEMIADYAYLINGDTKSCGCLKKEVLCIRNTKHAMCGSYTYKKWRGMWSRIRDTKRPKNKCYENVVICDRWKEFDQFYIDMGECAKGMSLDRIDNSKGYDPTNCRWVPISQQASNTTRNKFYEMNGERKTLSMWSRAYDISPDVVFDRINKLKWSIEEALTTPKLKVGGKRPKINLPHYKKEN